MNKIFLLALVLPLCAYSQELCNENGKSKALDEEVKQLKIDSFIGVPFGVAKSKISGIHLLSYKDDETKKEVVFYRPFRNFKQGIVKFDKDSKLSNAVDTEFCYPPNKSKKDIINEVMTIKSIFEKKYGIEMMEGGIGFALYDHQLCAKAEKYYLYHGSDVDLEVACWESKIPYRGMKGPKTPADITVYKISISCKVCLPVKRKVEEVRINKDFGGIDAL